jgi:acetyl esterase/lipase
LNIASHFDRGKAHGEDQIDLQSCRPDFVVLLSTWPGGAPTLDRFPLSSDSPMTFIAIAKDDRTAPPPFTDLIVAKLKELNVPVQLYQAERGGHGAFHIDEPNVDVGWKQPFLEWMRKNKLLAE